jgi:hypothetical protein
MKGVEGNLSGAATFAAGDLHRVLVHQEKVIQIYGIFASEVIHAYSMVDETLDRERLEAAGKVLQTSLRRLWKEEGLW